MIAKIQKSHCTQWYGTFNRTRAYVEALSEQDITITFIKQDAFSRLFSCLTKLLRRCFHIKAFGKHAETIKLNYAEIFPGIDPYKEAYPRQLKGINREMESDLESRIRLVYVEQKAKPLIKDLTAYLRLPHLAQDPHFGEYLAKKEVFEQSTQHFLENGSSWVSMDSWLHEMTALTQRLSNLEARQRFASEQLAEGIKKIGLAYQQQKHSAPYWRELLQEERNKLLQTLKQISVSEDALFAFEQRSPYFNEQMQLFDHLSKYPLMPHYERMDYFRGAVEHIIHQLFPENQERAKDILEALAFKRDRDIYCTLIPIIDYVAEQLAPDQNSSPIFLQLQGLRYQYDLLTRAVPHENFLGESLLGHLNMLELSLTVNHDKISKNHMTTGFDLLNSFENSKQRALKAIAAQEGKPEAAEVIRCCDYHMTKELTHLSDVLEALIKYADLTTPQIAHKIIDKVSKGHLNPYAYYGCFPNDFYDLPEIDRLNESLQNVSNSATPFTAMRILMLDMIAAARNYLKQHPHSTYHYPELAEWLNEFKKSYYVLLRLNLMS